MKGLFTHIALICCLCSASHASNVNIRSAEHEGFTRIAIDLQNPDTIEVTQKGQTIYVSLPKSTTAISKERFFQRISRSRIAEISSDIQSQKLSFELGCKCTFKTFAASPKTHVIDVSDEVAAADATVGSSSTPNWTRFGRVTKNRLNFADVDDPELEVSFEELEQNKSPSLKLGRSSPNGTTTANFVTQRLHSTLATALAQSSKTETDIETNEVSAIGNEQISFRSQVVLQNSEITDIEQKAQRDFDDCSKAEALDPSGWENYETAHHFLTTSRRNAAAGFEGFEARAARELATAYLSLAMGAEAQAILATVEEPTLTDERLVELANLTDGNSKKLKQSWFHGIAACPEISIWKILNEAQSSVIDRHTDQLSDQQLKAIRAQFDQWPSALKGVFGPRLAQALSKRNALETAMFTLRKSQNEPGLKSGEREIVEANINPRDLSPSELRQVLKPIANSDVDTAPSAVISLAELAVEQGENLGEAERVALVSYQNELKGTELEPELLRARIITAIQDAEFETAISLITEYSELVRPSKTNLVLDKLGKALFETESDAGFLREAVSLPAVYFNKIAEQTRTQIKQRVEELGFEELAEQLGRSIDRSDGRVDRGVDQQRAGIDAKDRKSDEGGTADPALTKSGDQLAGKEADGQLPAENDAVQSAQVQQNVTPLAKAIQDTQVVLESVAELKEELRQLGL